MHKAMFHEDSGYYRTKNPIGKKSDFITAPEISQSFGELIAAYLLQIFSEKKDKISLVEMGAGRGVLFFDILTVIKKMAERKSVLALEFLSRTTFHIIEINDVLKKIQQEKLSGFNVKWHEKFDNFQQEAEQIFFISNELFDCFPIDQFVKTDIGWCERLIEGDKFITKNFTPKDHELIQNMHISDAPFGAIFEYSESARNFMKELCDALKSKGGIAINFDYGYLESEFANTLQAVKAHKKVNPLENPGNADLTAHVDFGALNKIAKKADLNSSLVTQREFLTSLGIEERRKSLLKQNPEKTEEVNSSIDRLIMPDQMGELFKCHIIWSQ